MTGQASAPGDGPGPAPVSCALSSADLAAQAARWQQLGRRAMLSRQETDDGVRICFRPGPGVEEELRALAAVESECCPWATWTVHAAPGELVLAVASAGDGITALHGIFTGSPGLTAGPEIGD